MLVGYLLNPFRLAIERKLVVTKTNVAEDLRDHRNESTKKKKKIT